MTMKMTTAAAAAASAAGTAPVEKLKVAVIGGGAAGLAAARILSKSGHIRPIVFEKDAHPGGIWRHVESKKEEDDEEDETTATSTATGETRPTIKKKQSTKVRPMYRGLRTNLPREIMGYREKPWGNHQYFNNYNNNNRQTTGSSSSSFNVDGKSSYVTHQQVYQYLQDYKQQFDLDSYIRYGCTVTQLEIIQNKKQQQQQGDSKAAKTKTDNVDDEEEGVMWPKISLKWEKECIPNDNNDENENENDANCSSSAAASSADICCYSDTFDAVCVCNGHYAAPSSPFIPGLEENVEEEWSKEETTAPSSTTTTKTAATTRRVTVMHSIEYNDPAKFSNQTVVCVGGRASGSDLAREISLHAKHVYLSDSTHTGPPETLGNVTLVPRTVKVMVDNDGNHNNENGDSSSSSSSSIVHFHGGAMASNVDVIILCTGYDYNFPFINEKSNLDFQAIPGERRVAPLYEQLWHAQYPSLAFIGIPHSVLPFPLFELQMEAVVAQLLLHHNIIIDDDNDDIANNAPPLLKKRRLPSSVGDRMEAARRDGAATATRRLQDVHHLGSNQWDYCRNMSHWAGNYSPQLERYIQTNKAIYDAASAERKKLFPGGPDLYRSTQYVRIWHTDDDGADDDNDNVKGGDNESDKSTTMEGQKELPLFRVVHYGSSDNSNINDTAKSSTVISGTEKVVPSTTTEPAVST